MAQDAPILVLDEPTVHLDLRHQVEVMELLGRLSRDGVTVLAVLFTIWIASAAARAERARLGAKEEQRPGAPPQPVGPGRPA